MFDRMVDRLGAAASTTSTSYTSTTSAQAAAALMRFGGLASSAEKSQDKIVEEPLREEDGQLSVDVAERMLKWHAEAIGRCVELTPANDVCVIYAPSMLISLIEVYSPKHTFALLRVLAAAIGSAYVETAIETWVNQYLIQECHAERLTGCKSALKQLMSRRNHHYNRLQCCGLLTSYVIFGSSM